MTVYSRPIRAGMIGGGQGAFIGQVHRMAARLDGDFDWVCGVFSRDQENNHATGRGLNLSDDRLYDDWETLIAREGRLPADRRVQLLVIATPNHLHVPVARAALMAGIHVFSEKPAGVNFAEVKELGKALESSERLYGLAHTYIGYPLVWQAREMVERGELGQLRKIHVEYPQGWLGHTVDDPEAWRADPARSGAGGCLGDIGTHAFNLAEFVSGQHVNTLCASLGIHAAGRTLDDDVDILFRTAEGTSGSLIASQICSGEENGLKLRVYGELGGLEWHQMEPNTLIHRPQNAPARLLRAGIDNLALFPAAHQRLRLPGGHPEGYLEALGNLYRYFATAIRKEEMGAPSGVPGIDSALRGMAFVETALASQNSTEKWIPLNLDS
ncbi:Gfo/Idh/MocA family protein [Salinicola halimionae]|uniref:Gfo/Idh/MocA family protein n=1 Tax=Salinicola halimionae TaxID=1949081 RepID=UPI000DA11673|nr:Gfo/Idh/MocA family oxidoreductase [Salinicola halimionae]